MKKSYAFCHYLIIMYFCEIKNHLFMRTGYTIITLALLLLLGACNNDGEYVINGDTVCYSYWTFSFGTVNDTLHGANPKSFKAINKWAGHDGKSVYFKSKLVEGADAATIKADKYPLLLDKRDYYYKGVALHVGNVGKFKVLKWSEDNFWGIDNTSAYYDTIRIDNCDLASFKVLGYNVAVDRNHVYRYGKILPLADPETYDEDWTDYYSRDKSHIWYMGTLLEDADHDSFEVDKEQIAHDKNGYFYRDKRVSKEEIERLQN